MASTEMFQALYFSNHEREDERCVCVGVVYAILIKGVRVQIPRFVYIPLVINHVGQSVGKYSIFPQLGIQDGCSPF